VKTKLISPLSCLHFVMFQKVACLITSLNVVLFTAIFVNVLISAVSNYKLNRDSVQYCAAAVKTGINNSSAATPDLVISRSSTGRIQSYVTKLNSTLYDKRRADNLTTFVCRLS
jgi:hypothetical protein